MKHFENCRYKIYGKKVKKYVTFYPNMPQAEKIVDAEQSESESDSSSSKINLNFIGMCVLKESLDIVSAPQIELTVGGKV